MNEWETVTATCVVCPKCAFTFDECHTNTVGDDRYTCPLCELLTADEHQLIYDIGHLMDGFVKIMGDDQSRGSDLDEAVAHVHVLQKMVMGQAAARAFPGQYRVLGGRIAG